MRFHSEMDVTTHFRRLLGEATDRHFKSLKGSGWATDSVLSWESPTRSSVRVFA